MRQEYRRAITELVIVGETIVSENTPVGVTGQLRAGVTGKVITHNLGVVIVTGPGAKYVDAVEGGRHPQLTLYPKHNRIDRRESTW